MTFSLLRDITRPAAQANVPGPRWHLGYGRRFWLLLGPTAIVAGAIATGLKLLLRGVEHTTWSYHSGLMTSAAGATGAAHRMAALAVAGAMAGVIWWALERWWGTRGGGMTGRIWSRDPEMNVGPTVATAGLTTTIIAMGASLGREAPPKEAAAALASLIGRWGKLSRDERSLLMACAAGGAWAAIYNIPFAGGVFAAEVLIGTLALPVVIPAVAVSAVSTALSEAVLSVHPYYVGVPTFHDSPTLLAWAVVAGPVLGFAAMAFVWLLGAANTHRVSGNWLLCGPLVAFSTLGAISVFYPQILGNGRDLGEVLFLHGLRLRALVALVFLKPVLTVACWGSGASGGMFTPVTAYGALAGGLLGDAWSLAWPGVPAGAFALVGASAIISAGMAAPLSGVVLMFELTGGHLFPLLLPVLLAVVGASITARMLGGGSIYSVRLPPESRPERWRSSGTWTAHAAAGGARTSDRNGEAASARPASERPASEHPARCHERPWIFATSRRNVPPATLAIRPPWAPFRPFCPLEAHVVPARRILVHPRWVIAPMPDG